MSQGHPPLPSGEAALRILQVLSGNMESDCVDELIARGDGEDLSDPAFEVTALRLFEAETAESNLISRVYECRHPGCNRVRSGEFRSDEFVASPDPVSGKCLARKLGSRALPSISE